MLETNLTSRVRRGRSVLRIVPVFIAVAGALFVMTHFPLNPDVGWFMSIARRMLAGEALYTDIIDVNPPLITYLMMLPALFADWFEISDVAALHLFVVLLTAASIATCLVALDAPGPRSLSRPWWAIAMLTAFLVLPAYDFGQRELLLMISTFPYVLVRWRRAVGLPVSRSLGITVGVFGALGFAIKPFFVALWLTVEAASRILGGRPGRFSVDSETFSAGVVLAIMAAFGAIVHHEYLALMSSIAHLYGDFGVGFGASAILALGYALPIALMVPAMRNLRRPAHVLLLLLLAYAAVALVLAILQGKGWRYHFLPSLICITFIGALLLEEHIGAVTEAGSRKTRVMHLLGITAVILAMGLMSLFSAKATAGMESQQVVLAEREAGLEDCDASSILVLGEVVSAAYPLLNNLGAESASPFVSMWWLRAIYAGKADSLAIHALDAMGPVERRFHELQVRRFVRDAPDLVLVGTAISGRFGSRSFPYIRYFAQDEAFATEWDAYEKMGSVGYLDVYARQDDRSSESGTNATGIERCPDGNAQPGK